MNCPKCGEELLNVKGKYICFNCGVEVPDDQAISGQPVTEQVKKESAEVILSNPPKDEELVNPLPSIATPLDLAENNEQVKVKTEVVPVEPPSIIKDEEQTPNISEIISQPDQTVALEVEKEDDSKALTETQEINIPDKANEILAEDKVEINPSISTMAGSSIPNKEPEASSNLSINNPGGQPQNIISTPPTTPPLQAVQSINNPIQDEETLDKKKKILLILAICGGGLIFLIIGLLVGYFYNA